MNISMRIIELQNGKIIRNNIFQNIIKQNYQFFLQKKLIIFKF